MPKEPGRLQLDLRDVPLEAIAKLKLAAFENDETLTAHCRTILVRHALKHGETDFGPPAPCDTIPAVARPPWET